MQTELQNKVHVCYCSMTFEEFLPIVCIGLSMQILWWNLQFDFPQNDMS